MATVFYVYLVTLLSFYVHFALCNGRFVREFKKGEDIFGVPLALYKNTDISVKIQCHSYKTETPKVRVKWLLRWTPCFKEYYSSEIDHSEIDQKTARRYYDNPGIVPQGFDYKFVYKLESSDQDPEYDCGEHDVITLPDRSSEILTKMNTNGLQRDTDGNVDDNISDANKKQETSTNTTKVIVKEKREAETKKPLTNSEVVCKTDRDGAYLYILKIESVAGSDFNATATVSMVGPHGYINARSWPLLPFYGAMCIVYIIYGLVWLLLSMCNWKDILRIQFWIGAVIFLGMLEKAIFFATYEAENTSGIKVTAAHVFAEIVSCGKRTLARILVVIVSLGFGIVKPRLGPMLPRVLSIGFFYFVFSSIESYIRTVKPSGDTKQILLASVPLAVIDAVICWWVFTSLVQTTRTLRLRRNLVKLSLYRHFTNTLIFAVLASIAYMAWSTKEHQFTKCLSDWKELWVDEAFWHLLFSVLLLIIMILWRPNINNQRYAFSPLMDSVDDDEAEEPMIPEAFNNVKSRSKKETNGFHVNTAMDKTEEDLKWIDENIPASVADTALPSLLDSDEEILTTRFEMSKME